jgi:hypothetical protein
MHSNTHSQKRHHNKTTGQRGCNSESNTLSEISNSLPHLVNRFTPHTECGSSITVKEDQVFKNVRLMEQQCTCQRLGATEQGWKRVTPKAWNQRIHQKDARSQSKLSQKQEYYSEKLTLAWQKVHQTSSPSGKFSNVLAENGCVNVLTTRTELMT